jgi:hypothetical protein
LKQEEPGDDVGAEEEEGLDSAISRRLQKNLESEKAHVSFKQKTGTWGYKTVTEKVDRSLTREDLLDMRAKRVHDKYC